MCSSYQIYAVAALIMIAVKRVPPEVIIDCRLIMGIRRSLAAVGASTRER